MLVGQHSTIGEDQTLAIFAGVLPLAKLAGHLRQSVHAVIVSSTTERGEATEKRERRRWWEREVVLSEFRDDRETAASSQWRLYGCLEGR